MMQYRNQPCGSQNRGSRHRMRGIYGFPWLFVFFLIYATGWWQWFIMGSATVYNQQQTYYQPGQPETYDQPDPPQTYYQLGEQQKYPQYQQGYQPAQPPVQAQQDVYKQSAQEQTQAETYQDYEQPQTEYPQQMPPM
jgi:uncharacterized iron-regulated membrane protein